MVDNQRDKAPGSTSQEHQSKTIVHLPKRYLLIPFVLTAIAIFASFNDYSGIRGLPLPDTNVGETAAADGLQTKRNVATKNEEIHLKSNVIKNEEETKDKHQTTKTSPTFYFHFGPKKTGSTTIQQSFATSHKLLQSTSPYRYVGRIKKEVPGVFTAEITETRSGTKTLSKELLSHLRQGYSPIFSSERLSSLLFKADNEDEKDRYANIVSLVSSVEKDGWHVKPVVVYRRLFSWVTSYHAQRVFRFKNPQCRMSLLKWFDLHDEIWECTHTDKFVDKHPTTYLIERLKSHLGLDDVAIVNMSAMKREDESDIFRQVVREVLPGSELFLKKFGKTYALEPGNTSASKITDYHHLATAMSIIKGYGKTKTMKVANNMSKELDKIAKIFGGEDKIPTHCFSKDQLKKLLDMSLKFEKELFPEWFAMDGTEESHRKEFQEYVEVGKFCEWDVMKMLKKKELRDYVIKIFSKVKMSSDRSSS